MRGKDINYLNGTREGNITAFRKKSNTFANGGKYWNVNGSFRNDAKVQKAFLNRLSEIAIEKTMNAKPGSKPQTLLNSPLFAPAKNMVKHIQIAGVNLTINPSLPSFENNPFILEKVSTANLNFSNKG